MLWTRSSRWSGSTCRCLMGLVEWSVAWVRSSASAKLMRAVMILMDIDWMLPSCCICMGRRQRLRPHLIIFKMHFCELLAFHFVTYTGSDQCVICSPSLNYIWREAELFTRDASGVLRFTPFTRMCQKLWISSHGRRFCLPQRVARATGQEGVARTARTGTERAVQQEHQRAVRWLASQPQSQRQCVALASVPGSRADVRSSVPGFGADEAATLASVPGSRADVVRPRFRS